MFIGHWDRSVSVSVSVSVIKAHSHRAEAKIKAKFLFNVWIFSFDLVPWLFDLFRFQVRFLLVWTHRYRGSNDISVIRQGQGLSLRLALLKCQKICKLGVANRLMHHYPLIALYSVTLTANISCWICKNVAIYYLLSSLNSVVRLAITRKRTIFCFCKYLLFVSSVQYLDRMGLAFSYF